jgi:double zinc ribbon protein
MRLDRLPFFARAQPVPPDPPAEGDPSAETPEAPAPPPPPLTPATARRERHALVRRREVELRDVGGLAVEMVRRARFKPDLLVARCNDVLALEQRIWDLDSYLATAEAALPSLREATLCRCGAPLIRGAHFCSHCGRPAADTPPVVSCGHCGNPLPAEANFCSFCGNAVPPEQPTSEPAPEDTLVREDPT